MRCFAFCSRVLVLLIMICSSKVAIYGLCGANYYNRNGCSIMKHAMIICSLKAFYYEGSLLRMCKYKIILNLNYSYLCIRSLQNV
jgi:hypothetical protein